MKFEAQGPKWPIATILINSSVYCFENLFSQRIAIEPVVSRFLSSAWIL